MAPRQKRECGERPADEEGTPFEPVLKKVVAVPKPRPSNGRD